MQMISGSVGRASRAWDQQHLDLTAAARQIGEAPTAGFTDGVAGAAARFTTTWSRHTDRLAADAEVRADGLRTTIRDFLATDAAVGLDAIVLLGYVTEQR